MTENGDALDDCNVFVKYLPPDVNDQELHNLFANYGKIKSAKVMFDPQTGTSLGYGFVRFETSEEAKKAIADMSEKKIGNRTLLCKLSKIVSNHTNLYIKPLLDNTSEEDLRNLFLKFGQILNCKVMVDKQTGTSRRIGFVRFATKESAAIAIQEMNGVKLTPESPALIVRHAETLYQKNIRKMRNIPQKEYVVVPQPVPVPYVIDALGFPQQVAYQLPPVPPLDMGSINFIPPICMPSLQFHPDYNYPYSLSPEQPNLFVFHLPPDMNDEGLHDLFQEFGPIESVKVITDKNTGESKGYGFVKFVKITDAERALSLNGKSVGTKRLSVSFKTQSPRNSPASSPRGPNTGIHSSPRQYSPSPGLLYIEPPHSPRTWTSVISPR